jgi:anti-anti-sigma factor
MTGCKSDGDVVGLTISTRVRDDVTIVDLRGRSTIGESELLDRHLQKLLASGARKVLLNLTELTQVDSSGLSIIIATCASLRRHDGDLKMLRPSGHVLEVFRVLRLLGTITSFDDETQALASFRSLGHAASSS